MRASSARGTERLSFLGAGASRAAILRAIAANHIRWMSVRARLAGGEAYRLGGATWIWRPERDGGEGAILFPRFTRAHGAEQLDQILTRARGMSSRCLGCWTLDASRSGDLGARLTARGFEWGWRPHWMALDLRRIARDERVPPGMRVGLVEDEAAWDARDLAELPYHAPGVASHARAVAYLRSRRRRIWHFAAWLDERPVGQVWLHLTSGRLGVAGLYGTGVVPTARRLGVGAALTVAACEHARALGCRYATLNATDMGEPVYRRVGFESLGYGQTWWMHRAALGAPSPGEPDVAFAEAIGRADVRTLGSLAPMLRPGMLDATLLCGSTPLQLAVAARQPASAEWLVRAGATLDVLSAWDLGWRDRVPALLDASPDLANRRGGALRTTPLHEAAARGDLELARVLLAAHPDLTARDAEY
ncbi:MAG: GNAT family N-acetyltransferase, partial [Gemmatimonadaceae bacterium]